MNKQHEIDILKQTVITLGNDSYCAKWLNDQIPIIESAIKSDVTPDCYGALTWDEARAEAGRIIAAAKTEAERIARNSETQIEQSRKFCDQVMRRARDAGEIISNMQNSIRALR